MPMLLPAALENAQLMHMGRQDIKETNVSLLRSERIVSDTVAVGAQTAETLQEQGMQLEKVRLPPGEWCTMGCISPA